MKQIKTNLSLLLVLAGIFIVSETNITFGYSPGETGSNVIDIKSKAQELGIFENQLREILNLSMEGINPNDSLQTDAISSSKLYGADANNYFGGSVADAGDVNGDGFHDIIVGAFGASSAGRAYIYFGGVNFDNIIDVILTGEASNDRFGRSVSSAGDVNGDGFGDVVVGATFADKAYIYFGGVNMNSFPDKILNGETADDYFGNSVSGAGDLNGDGFGDVIVGALNNDAGGNLAGRAYIYFGGSNMNNVADVIFTGEAAGDMLGNSVSNAGDVNGDGFDDAIVGAYFNDGGGNSAGRAYIYFGGANMNNIADIIFTGEATINYLGTSVSSAGDINGDGFSDLIIGASHNDAGGTDAGRAYIYFGGTNMNNSADVILTGETAGDQFGISVSSANDMNGDGFGDVIIGAYNNDAGGSNAGRAYIYFGGVTMNNTVDVVLTGEAANDLFGYAICSIEDMNGDGLDEIVVGASNNDAGGSDAGAAYVYKNSLTGPDIADIKFAGSSAEFLGSSASNAGDINNDGFEDIIIGAYGNTEGGVLTGKAYIYFGGVNMNNTADVIFTGEAANNSFGYSVSTAGDVNGDGYDDVIVSAHQNSAGGNNAGRAYIYFGGANMNNVADVVFTGETAFNGFGYSVSNAGDVNRDGYGDVIIGAYMNSSAGSNAGKVYIYLGGANINNIADITMTGEAANDYFGYSVSNAGDVNGDSFGDVIVSAYGNDAGGSDAGKTYIYFGGINMNNVADVIITGEAANDNFGYSVSNAGDVNGDSFGDVIVGAYGNDAGGNSAGRAYVYFGGYTMNNTADIIFTGGIVSGRFGVSVSNAGDVNGDGFSDCIIGAAAPSIIGKAYIYFGGSAADNIADILLNGSMNDDYFGQSISYAGDINQDGLSDVVVGALAHDEPFIINAGAAFLYMSSSPPIAPRIMSVKDVPNDQGGFVMAKFIRSGYDSPGMNKITGYLIERSRPPDINGFFWEPVTTISPNSNLGYLYTAQTWGDSSSGGSDRVYFRVTAQTNNSNEFWRSNIMYGGSIDNLSPSVPLNLLASSNPDYINLGWDRNTEPDFKDYLIYRNNANISVSNINGFIDTTANPDSLYIYEIAARDIHGNISPLSTPDSASLESITLYNVKIIPEGIYSTSTDQLRMRDTVRAYLWDLTGSTIVDSGTSVIDSVTFMTNFEFRYAPSGTYYLAIVHRNCIETWSKIGGEAMVRGAAYDYDFTNMNTQAYGDNLKLKGTRYCLYSGDINSSGVINSTDRTLIKNNVGYLGYSRFDLDGNGVVNSSDRTIVRNNTGVFKQRP